MLTTITSGKDVSTSNHNASTNQASTSYNAWNDKTRVKSLRVVDKDIELQCKDIDKSVTSNGLQFSGQYVSKKGDHVFVLPSQAVREKFRNQLLALKVSQLTR